MLFLYICKQDTTYNQAMKIKIYLTYTTIFFTLFFFSACQNNSRNSKQEGKANLEIEEYISLLEKDSLNTKLIITLGNYYSKQGNIEKLIEFATPIYSKASKQKDSAALIHCSALLANAYNINEKIDSLNKYLEILSGYDLKDYPSIRGLVDNIKGGYYLNYSIDYPRSLSHFISAYEQIKTYDYPDNKIIILNNIVEICYALEDPSGIFYAREALKLTDEEGVDKYSHSQANSALAKMLLLNNQTDSAIFYALKADNYLADNQNNYKTNTQFLLGDIYYQRNDFTTAQKYYQSALKISDSSIRRVHAKILLNYGHNMFRLKEFEKAIEIYKQGINASANIHEIETKRDLYISLFEAYYMLNIEEQATEYYSKYYILRDSIQKLKQNTQKFNSHTVFRHSEEFKNDILSENSKNTDFGLNNSSLFSSILIVLLIIVVTYLILNQRNKKVKGMWKITVKKKKQILKRKLFPHHPK